MKIIRNFLFLGLALSIGLMPVQEMLAAPKRHKQAKVQVKAQAPATKATPKKLTWKQKISRSFKSAQNFIANHAGEIIFTTVALGIAGYLVYSKARELNTRIDQRRNDLDLRREARMMTAQNMHPGLFPGPIPPQGVSRGMIALFEREEIRNGNGSWPMIQGIFRSNTPQGNDLRNAIYREAQFYPPVTREQYQQARDRIHAFNMAARRQRIARDVRNYLLVPELTNDIATIGFWHMHNNPAQIGRMPDYIRQNFIHSMAIRHHNGLENLIARLPEHVGHVINQVNDYNLPTLDEVRVIMAQRLNAIMQPAGAQ